MIHWIVTHHYHDLEQEVSMGTKAASLQIEKDSMAAKTERRKGNESVYVNRGNQDKNSKDEQGGATSVEYGHGEAKGNGHNVTKHEEEIKSKVQLLKDGAWDMLSIHVLISSISYSLPTAVPIPRITPQHMHVTLFSQSFPPLYLLTILCRDARKGFVQLS